MKKYRYLILTAVVAVFASAVWLLWQPLMDFAADPAALHQWLEAHGAVGVLIFALLNAVQVIIAVIPGGPFEVAAGYLFGPWLGTLLCDVAMTCGSVFVFLLVKKLGMPFIRLFFSQEQIESVHLLKDTKRLKPILFLLFLVPGTPKDLITYLVGLTKLPLGSWITICFVGRLPAILFSALGGSALEEAEYGMVIAVAVILTVSYLVGTWFYQRWNKKDPE